MEGNIKMDLNGDMDLIHFTLGKGQVVSCCEHGVEPLGSIKNGQRLD
jgi:hypothetical protein